MRSDGWKFGTQFDGQRRMHDALRPFDELADADRAALRVCLQDDSVLDGIADAVSYPRGPARPFTATELRKGLRVGFVEDDGTLNESEPLGRVSGWTFDAADIVETVSVVWDDGEESIHANAEGELYRVDERPS